MSLAILNHPDMNCEYNSLLTFSLKNRHYFHYHAIELRRVGIRGMALLPKNCYYSKTTNYTSQHSE